jgi:hypothetical protein
MKILMTGMTSKQSKCSSRGYFLDVPKVLYEYAVKLGHDVDWRRVELGEDLSSYDLAIISIAPVHSLNSRTHCFQSLWVMSQLPCVLFLDDWNVYNVVSGFKQLCSEGRFDKFINKNYNGWFFMNPPEYFKPYEEEIMSSARLFLENTSSHHKLVAPLFTWGDKDKLLKLIPNKLFKFYSYDPSIELIKNFTGPLPQVEKQRRWFLPTLGDHMNYVNKQNLSWPVDWIGHKKKTGVRMHEREVFQKASEYFGYFSPRYHHDGCGWWRARFIFSAMAGCVLHSSLNDQAQLGGAFVLDSSIEQKPNSYLMDVAKAQAEIVLPKVVSEEGLLASIKNILENH